MIKSQQTITYVFGWLLFGNIVDNAFDPKNIIVVCSAMLGIYFVGLGLYCHITAVETVEYNQDKIIITKDSSMIIYAGLELFTII